MIIDPRSSLDSVDRQLAKLDDAELAEHLRAKNPHLFSSHATGTNFHALAFAAAGMFSVVAGFIIEPAIFPPRPPHANGVAHRVPAHTGILRHSRSHAAAVAKNVVPSTQIQPVAPHERVYYPGTPTRLAPHIVERAYARAQTSANAQAEAQARAAADAQTWLRAEARARAQDAARMKPEVVITETAPSAPQTLTGPVTNNGGPIAQAPPPANPLPLPVGGRCTPNRGSILVHGHGVGNVLVNIVLRTVRVGGVPLFPP